ncbi:carboxypeptidase-like regulatory domain-containing protein [Flavobacterium humi]|uniref:Carboxypeptidase-like regulatory domain-containing protein n=2 Tax=Flavobacterium humi TaxID=2562683 RepID=A0A4Z0L8K8_9FLAO|nr:carboxypeptidase-like regulatory domain-containing protein [Flavobacterium humi]
MIQKSTLLLFLAGFSMTAQIKGTIKDSLSGKPIPYVNIWVVNENIGTTSEENGEFTLNVTDKDKTLLFSALGFEKKTIKASQEMKVALKPIAYQLDEVVVAPQRLETKEQEIGQTENKIYQAFDNGPRIDTKYFPYNSTYRKTRFIKQVSIQTDSKITDAILKIHFYGVDPNGYPGEELLDKDFIVTVKKGVRKNTFDVTELNLTIPKKGLFVGFEKLIIERNKTEKTVTDLNTNKTQIQKAYAPFVLYGRTERTFLFTFSGGKWIKKTKSDTEDPQQRIKISEPAINLVLTN